MDDFGSLGNLLAALANPDIMAERLATLQAAAARSRTEREEADASCERLIKERDVFAAEKVAWLVEVETENRRLAERMQRLAHENAAVKCQRDVVTQMMEKYEAYERYEGRHTRGVDLSDPNWHLQVQEFEQLEHMAALTASAPDEQSVFQAVPPEDENEFPAGVSITRSKQRRKFS